MPFYLYSGNRLDKLAQLLTDRLAASPPADPFGEELVIVQSQGVARWLKLEVAARLPICAGLDCPYPGAFLERELFAPMRAEQAAAVHPPDPARTTAFTPEDSRWRLFGLLERFASRPEFSRVRRFMDRDPLRRYQLAERLALLFDRYMTYRQDVLESWESGRDAASVGGADAAWQRELWRALVAETRGPQGEPHHFSGLCLQWLQRLAKRDSAFLDGLRARRRIFYFGFSTLPPAHLQIAWALAFTGVVDVHFFHLNPCAEDWSDTSRPKARLRDWQQLTQFLDTETARMYLATGNPLLGCWGRTGREFFRLMLEMDGIVEQSTFQGCDGDAPLPARALTVIQSDIEHNRPLPEVKDDGRPPPPDAPPATRSALPAVALMADDDSLQIHYCHSALREVEVLHDALRAAFDRDRALRPRQVRIFLPDPKEYTPYIEAVFGVIPPNHPAYIPYVIADKTHTEEFAECRGFLALLQTLKGRFTASDTLALLDVEAIAGRFGFEPQDGPTLQPLLARAGLAWGLDAAFRVHAGAARDPLNTWRFALDRLILGAAMSLPEAASPLDLQTVPCLPLDEAETHAAPIGKLAEFVAALTAAQTLLADLTASPPPAKRGLAALRDWRKAFLLAQGDTLPGVLAIDAALDRLDRQLHDADALNSPLAMTVWYKALADALEGEPRHERFVSGAVTFCRFQPMRSVPAALIGMLGMHDGAFPRANRRLSFDIMDAARRRIGDRDPRDDDRYSFLEALLAARQYLFISCIAQDPRDNKPRPPSALVGELLDYGNARFTVADDDRLTPAQRLIVRHPLHPFSPAYFAPDATRRRGLKAWSSVNFALAQRILEHDRKPPADGRPALPAPAPSNPAQPARPPEAPIALDDLIAFLCAPCKFYFTRCAGIRLELESSEQPEDEEPIDPDALRDYTLKRDLLERMLRCDLSSAGATHDGLLRRCQAEGRLPRPPETTFEAAWTDSVALAEALRADYDCAAPALPCPLRISLTDMTRLEGCLLLRPQRPDGAPSLVSWRPVSAKARDLIRHWVSHLALAAAAPAADPPVAGTSRLYALAGSGPGIRLFQPLDPDTARAYLNKLLPVFRRGLTRPVCFWPPAALAWHATADPEKARDNARKSWEPDAFGHDAIDVYTRRAFGEELPAPDSPAWQECTTLADALFTPLQQHSHEHP